MTFKYPTKYVSFENLAHDVVEPLGENNILLFDIDQTLYPIDNNIRDPIRNALFDLYKEKFAMVNPELASNTWKEVHGSGLRGAILEKGLTYEDIDCFYTNTINMKEYLKVDSELIRLIKEKNLRMWCVTNAHYYHARECLKALNMEDMFEYVIHIDYLNFDIRKPVETAYSIIEQTLDVTNTKNLHFFDDLKENIDSANKRGWSTYHITKEESLRDHLSKL